MNPLTSNKGDKYICHKYRQSDNFEMDSAIAGKRDKRCAEFSLAKLIFIICSDGISKVGDR